MKPELKQVSNLTDLNSQEVETVIATYQRAFALIPYLEAFSDEEACGALQYILDRNGDLIVGEDESGVISLAGGYMKDNGIYYIEELAVDPDFQGQGVGRQTLESLISFALSRDPIALEIRTTARNDKAINLYLSEGFALEEISEVVPSARQDGMIALDERVYLKMRLKEEKMRSSITLKRAAIAYPSGNTTAVVFDQMIGASNLNSQVIMESWKRLSPDKPEIEQCCFITLPNNPQAIGRVEMFGGEFCGNATRSAVALLTGDKDYAGIIEVSGVDRPLNFRVQDGLIAVEMPLPQSGDLATEVEEGTLVQLDGIAQLVVLDSGFKEQTPREVLDNILSQNKYGLADQSAVGITYYNPTTKEAKFCVWVNKENTIFDETACGSGTCAIGVAAASRSGQSQSLEVTQPSGESISTQATVDDTGKVITSSIEGYVAILYDGELSL